jgi:hypothetical protein
MTKPILSFLFSILLIGQPVVAQQAQWQWSGIEKVVSVADIHGAYDAFVTILGKSDLIDEQLNWSGDTAHLVIVGDVLDRGADSRKALELIMKLEEQAETAGGRVHMVLGNHEVMNLIGDLNYVSDDEYAAYIENEDSSMRSEINQEDMPPGFYGHRKLFSNTGTFGQWLLNKPVLLKVNDTIFTHGGISSDVLETSAAEINASYANDLRDYVTNINQLAAQGFLPLETDFYDHGNYLNVVIKKHQADGIEVVCRTITNLVSRECGL